MKAEFKKIMVTGGAGFIGSALIRLLLKRPDLCVINVDALTYAGDLRTLEALSAEEQERHVFYHLDLCDAKALCDLVMEVEPDAVIHLAAQTHVDRSIDAPETTIKSNFLGAFYLLEAVRHFWQQQPLEKRAAFRFLHVSTDEVYGALSAQQPPSREGDAYAPTSPYSASKAGADHLVRAWHYTYGLPVLMTHCCNNYGPYQYPEKLIPHIIYNALAHQPLPIYGDGLQQREWIHVDDHAKALWSVLQGGTVGSSYHVGTQDRISNLELVQQLCDVLQQARPLSAGHYGDLITHVADRPGHDQRYALDSQKICTELQWMPEVNFKEGLAQTIQWYLAHDDWCEHIEAKGYQYKRQGVMA